MPNDTFPCRPAAMKPNRRTRRAAEAQQRRAGTPPAGGFVVISRTGLSLAEATAPDRVSVLLPVPRGGVPALLRDPRMQTWHDLDVPVILAFADAADALALHQLIEARGPALGRLQ